MLMNCEVVVPLYFLKKYYLLVVLFFFLGLLFFITISDLSLLRDSISFDFDSTIISLHRKV